MVHVAETVAALRAALAPWRGRQRVALVPTMGALHAGHLGLVRKARAIADRVIVSIFVNPAQFAPHEDLARYPRPLETDLSLLSAEGVDLVYTPSEREIYPEGFATQILMGGPALGLESDFRPQFFGGVAIVVAKLFLQVRPTFAVFGEKDYQQLLVVRRLSKDLDLDLDIVGVATFREDDGLALSSRNAYLSPEQRRIAPALNKELRAVAARARSGAALPALEAEAAASLLSAGFERVDYVVIRDAQTLQRPRQVAGPARVLAAAWLGKTRLIDNVEV